MKLFIFLLIGVLLGFALGRRNYDTQVTYNTLGRKTVIAQSSTLQEAAVAVGQICEEEGYTIVSKEENKDGFLLTVECTKKEE